MEKIDNYLGKDTILEGRLTFEGTFSIDCNFKGDISAPGTLIVGEKGKIDSNIHVVSIICKGEPNIDVLDLREKLQELTDMIRRANGIDEK